MLVGSRRRRLRRRVSTKVLIHITMGLLNTDDEKMFVRLLKKYNLSSGEEAKPEKAGRAHAFRNLHEELEEFANEEAGVY